MRIAIYGDSWASEWLDQPHSYLGWPEILANQPNFEVDNFAVPGSSLYFSYREFLKNHKNYDINIFLITSFGRLYIESIPEYSKTAKHIPDQLTLINRKKQLNIRASAPDTTVNDKLIKIYNAINNYYDYMHNDEYNELVDKALVHHAKSMSTNTIFIPCFRGYNEFSLLDVYFMENDSVDASETYFFKGIHPNTEVDGKLLTDIRVCHMTKRNNELLAEKLINAIKENNFSVKLSLADFTVPIESIDDLFQWKDL
jgi:hypothetical protein